MNFKWKVASTESGKGKLNLLFGFQENNKIQEAHRIKKANLNWVLFVVHFDL